MHQILELGFDGTVKLALCLVRFSESICPNTFLEIGLIKKKKKFTCYHCLAIFLEFQSKIFNIF